MAVAHFISEQELQHRLLGVENAIAQQELEGLTVSEETVEDLHCVARGEITTDQAVERVQARVHHAALLSS